MHTRYCELCGGLVTREITIDMCYPKEYTCQQCGSSYIIDNKGSLILLEMKEIAAVPA